MLRRFICIDGHTCGNPVRMVVGGAPPLVGNTMLEKRNYFLQEYDYIRRGLMFEPRGHDMMSGSIIYPATRADCDVGILYIETSGCLPMCGHGTIGTVTFLLQEGLVKPQTPGVLRLDTPAGLVLAYYTQNGDKISAVKLINVASFLYRENIAVAVKKLGQLRVDVSYGGNFYAIVDPQENFKDIADYTASDLIGFSQELRENINNDNQFVHPLHPTINRCTHVLWAGKPTKPDSTARNAVFYGDKAIDRSPCGTGSSARLAQWVAKGRIGLNEPFNHESIIGSQFLCSATEHTKVGDFSAIIPAIQGWAKITGYNNITIDDDDPFCHGFTVI